MKEKIVVTDIHMVIENICPSCDGVGCHICSGSGYSFGNTVAEFYYHLGNSLIGYDLSKVLNELEIWKCEENERRNIKYNKLKKIV